MRRKHAKDLVQPSDPLFKRYYPEEHNKMERDRQDRHLGQEKIKTDRDKYIKQWRSTQHRYAMKKVLKLEEKL